MLRAVLFDNDGVLVDTEALFFQANRDTLTKAGIDLSLDRYVEYALRKGKSCLDLAAERGWSASQISDLRDQRDRAYSAMLAEVPGPMDHVRHTLSRLRGRFRMGVVTTSNAEHFYLVHRRFNLLEYFDFVIAREDYNHPKPNPEPYRAALERMRLSTDECVAVEDSERGLMAANAAGLRCVVVPHGLTRSGDFSKATAILPALSALPSFLESI